MTAADPKMRSLAEDVASSYETQASSSHATHATTHATTHQNKSLPSSITLYRTGRVLYSCHHHATTTSNNDNNTSNGSTTNTTKTNDNSRKITTLTNAFDNMISTLPVNYVHDIMLHNLHHAYASLIVSYATSASTTSSAISALGIMIGKNNKSSSTTLNGISTTTTTTNTTTSWKDIMEGTESLCGIYLSSVNACRSCCLSVSSEEGRHELELVFVALSWFYDYSSNTTTNNNNGKDNNGGMEEEDHLKKSILNTLSNLLIHGIIVQSSSKSNNNNDEEDMDEQLSNIMTLIQNIQSSIGEYNCALGDMLEADAEVRREQSFVTAIRTKFEAKDASQPPQLQYLLAMLRASPTSNGKKQPPPSSSNIANTTTASLTETNPESEPQKTMTDIQIDHIKGVLPTLGEGYIEEALKCYNHDVERTLEALLQVSEGGDNTNNNVHPRLFTIPSNLPRKLRDRVDHYSANVNLHRGATLKDDGKEHAKIQKQHIKHEEEQREAEAFLIENVSRSLGGLKVSSSNNDNNGNNDNIAGNDQLLLLPGNRNEYDDDYDDQYDGVGDGGMGGLGDEGLYDVDTHNVHQKYDRGGAKNEQEMWRKYNSLIKDVDAESAYWESNKNLNREQGYRPGKKRAEKNE
eukprot:CAMPEP_0196133596 /NCGR_PEP_ID=MMETSP0910-20130528/2757_1 /TAXON_ID=49265 /ORGANISM="Thalassiosira rotula, Strain GSO102" /LENGTH=633 /DNA_ID=CAMNT_0041393339 /DNA_START=91 /DNA_END=1989 /DNA_ORIENTATION=-